MTLPHARPSGLRQIEEFMMWSFRTNLLCFCAIVLVVCVLCWSVIERFCRSVLSCCRRAVYPNSSAGYHFEGGWHEGARMKKADRPWMSLIMLIISFSIAASMVLMISLMNSNTFPPPHGAGCGLEMPPGTNDTSSAQLVTRTQTAKQWIYVDLDMPAPDAHWLFQKECAWIHAYDIVEAKWAEKCSHWCDRHLGNFSFNMQCAFAVGPHADTKPMPLLRACQKARFASYLQGLAPSQWLSLAASGTWLLVCILVGSFRFFVINETQDVRLLFDSKDQMDGCIKVLTIPVCENVARGTEGRFSVVLLAVPLLLDVFTDINSAVLFAVQGQPFYAFAQVVAIMFGSGQDDVFSSSAIMWCFWSWWHGAPATFLLRRKQAEKSEAWISNLLLTIYFLKLPEVENEGTATLGWFSLVNYTVSIILFYYGIYESIELSSTMVARERAGHLYDDNYDAWLELRATTAQAPSAVLSKLCTLCFVVPAVGLAATTYLASPRTAFECATIIVGSIFLGVVITPIECSVRFSVATIVVRGSIMWICGSYVVYRGWRVTVDSGILWELQWWPHGSTFKVWWISILKVILLWTPSLCIFMIIPLYLTKVCCSCREKQRLHDDRELREEAAE